MSQESDALRRAIAAAATGAEQNALAATLAACDRAAAARKQADADLDWAATAVEATLTPVAVHSVHTAATDWLGDIHSTPDFSHRLIAEATLWYTRLPEQVRADTEEFTAQAHGAARRVAGRLGVHPAAAIEPFMDYVLFVRKQSGSGLPQIDQMIDANNMASASPYPPDVFDNFAPEVADVNAGTSGTEDSNRAPLIQEITGGGRAVAGPTAAPQLGDDADGAGAEEADEDEGPLTRATAVNHAYTLDDYLARTAALGEDGLYDTDDEDYHAGADEARGLWQDHQRQMNDLPSVSRQQAREREADMARRYRQQRYDDDIAEYGRDFADRALHGPDRRAEHGRAPQDLRHSPDASSAYLAAATRTAASGLDQIQQTTAPDGVTSRPTPLPVEVAFPWDISPNASNDAPPADGEMATGDGDGEHDHRAVAARQVRADQWHGQEWPHAAVQPDAANHPGTTPVPASGDYASGHAAGTADAAAEDTAPTYADASSAAPQYVRGYTDGYGGTPRPPGADVPPSLTGPPPGGRADGASARLSHLLSTPAERSRPRYEAGYRAGTGWKAGNTEVPAFGSDEFEAGLYAGLLDNPAAQAGFVNAHRRAAADGQHLAGRRIARHASASAAFAGSPQLPGTVRPTGPYLAHALTAGTSTDLDTMAPGTSADPSGSTPFNGPGTPPMLDGQYDAAEAAGPAPYNGAPPYGTPAVPNPGAQTAAPVTVPATGMTTPNRATAFRRLVQANLARTAAGSPLLIPATTGRSK